jgi:hypothetical protein
MTSRVDPLAHLDHRENLKQLRVLSDVVWDIEDQLAKAKAARARLMTNLQQDLRRHASEEAAPATCSRGSVRTVPIARP